MDLIEENGRAICSKAFAIQSFLLAKTYDLNSSRMKITHTQQHRAALQGFQLMLIQFIGESWNGLKDTNSLLAHEAAAAAHKKAATEYHDALSNSRQSTGDNELERLYGTMVQLHTVLSVKHTERSQYHNNTPSTVVTAPGVEWVQHDN
jgi:hypothetical protein